ncbi:hypothetical protein [Alkalibacillus aidingensis]|nr:hypothetical protein [Alkalibacillus aidingensis]
MSYKGLYDDLVRKMTWISVLNIIILVLTVIHHFSVTRLLTNQSNDQ